jgi:hypothetical protein
VVGKRKKGGSRYGFSEIEIKGISDITGFKGVENALRNKRKKD